MSQNNSLVEETLIQMKNLEEVIAENAKGILASTMKEEISELVKESLQEQKDEEIDASLEMSEPGDMDDETDEFEMSSSELPGEEESLPMDMDSDEFDSDEETIDLTGASDEEILKVFKAMGDEDGIIIKKDDEMIHLKDDNEDVEYMINLEESEIDMEDNKLTKTDVEDIFDDVFGEEMDEESMYEEMDEESMENKMDEESMDEEMDEESMEEMYEESMDEEMDEEEMDEEMDEVVYEITLDEEMDEESMDEEMDEENNESYHKMKTNESKMTVKPKGVGMGKGPGKTVYGKKVEAKEGESKMTVKPKGMGLGKGPGKTIYGKKSETKEAKGHDMTGSVKKETAAFGKKAETKEAARTFAMGSRNFPGRGLPKMRVKPNSALKEEVETLRTKNEEYRKALNIFRTKLNEVAVFNSNLAYATRLFTEHSTTKQEKINILRRFDNVDTIKESKGLYKSIKDELSQNEGKVSVVKESIENKIEKNPTSGSATNLIESKTYENPQFMRMKDLMAKLK